MKNLRKAAEGMPCIKCGIEDGTICARHYNGIRQHWYGKGRGKKCHDLASAELCMKCDDELSEGKGGWKSDEHSEEFLHWCMMTNIRRAERGIL